MNKLIALLSALVCGSINISAQISDLRGGGALLAGQAKIFSVLDADDALFGNIAAMPFAQNKWMIDAGAERRFGFEDLSLFSISGAYKFGNASAGLMIADFGDNLYKERKFQLSYAMQLASSFSMGASFNFLQLSIPEYGQSFTPTVDLGIYTKVFPNIHLGAHVQNLFQANKGSVSYPSTLSLGLHYEISDKVAAKLEVEKILDRKMSFKTALVYRPMPNFSAYVGVDAVRENLSLGLAYQFSGLKLAGAYTTGSTIGSSPSLNLRYSSKQSTQKLRR